MLEHPIRELLGSGEAFTTEIFFKGDFFDYVEVSTFDVDDALNVFGGHGW